MHMRESTGMVFDIRVGSMLDGPGSRTTVLFKGCSLSCRWCANPELQSVASEVRLVDGRCVRCGKCVETCEMDAAQLEDAPDSGTRPAIDREVCIVCGACIGGCQGKGRELVGRRMSVPEVMAQIEAGAQPGGVTFSGGEPLLQSAFLADLLRACKARGIHTVVDTSGYAPWEIIDRLRADVDLFLFDLKLMDEERHRAFTGLPNTVILENARSLSHSGQRLILRVRVIPGINNDKQNLLAIARFAAALPNLEGVEIVPDGKADEIVRLFESFGLSAKIMV